ncbi:hypothetical protein L2E82_32017 [Cichorium intybus]|uniref:Uncharacterized protein n=1 Tax=Cichorium intybus TaxID=13427 RepID=A0ACB9BIY1_CICIN|nr:hypothetical protein L2E82_32017 [Cichorium intybus]
MQILKRSVAIQHERQKEYDERSQEVQQLKQLLSQYQEQLNCFACGSNRLNETRLASFGDASSMVPISEEMEDFCIRRIKVVTNDDDGETKDVSTSEMLK